MTPPAQRSSSRKTGLTAQVSTSLDALDAHERAIVELVSVFYEPVPRTDLARALGEIGEREQNRAPRGDEILPMLLSLTARGWLVGETSWGVRPDLVHAITLRAAEAGRLARMAKATRMVRPALDRLGLLPRTAWQRYVREVRIELYEKRWEEARNCLGGSFETFAEICRPFDRAWLESLPSDLRGRALMGVLDESVRELEAADEALAMLETQSDLTDGEHHLLVEQTLLRGRLDDAEELLRTRASVQAQVGRAWLLALRGRWSEAIAEYERALAAFFKVAGKRKAFFPDHGGIFFIVALIADGKPTSLERAKVLAEAGRKQGVSRYPEAYAVLSEAARALTDHDETEALHYVASEFGVEKLDGIELLLRVAAAVWVGKKVPAALAGELAKRSLAADAAGYAWLATQGADAVLAAHGKDDGGRLSALRARLVGQSLARAVTRKERWSGALDALLEIASSDRASRAAVAPIAERDVRLVWIVTEHTWGFDVAPREQSRTKGRWSKGRPVALKRLALESASMDFLAPEDRVVCAGIEEHVEGRYYGRYRDVSYALDPGAALRALIGQPNVFTEIGDALVPVEIRAGAASLTVERRAAKGGFRILLDPMPSSPDETVVLKRAGPSTIEVVQLGEKQQAIAKVLGKKGLELPAAAQARLRQILAAISRFVPASADLEIGPEDAGVALRPTRASSSRSIRRPRWSCAPLETA